MRCGVNFHDTSRPSADFSLSPSSLSRHTGKVFVDFKAELEEVYKVYCQNHDDAISLLESYEKDESIQRHVLECLERLR